MGSAISGVMDALGALTAAIGRLIASVLGHHHPHLKGGDFMFIVKDDNPDVRYSLAPVVATDAEGQTIPDAPITVAVVSDNADVVAVTPDADPHTGSVHFGAPGTAALTATFSFGDKVLGVKGAQITVTAGDPAAISGGDITLEGLTEAPAPPPAPGA